MNQASTGSQVISADLAHVSEVLFAIDQYANWTDGIAGVSEILRNDKGQITQATLKIESGVVKDDVTLKYGWESAPTRLNFSLVKGKTLKKMDGAYILEAVTSDTTKVTYELSVGVSGFIPQMMIASQEKAIITRALLQLKEFIER